MTSFVTLEVEEMSRDQDVSDNTSAMSEEISASGESVLLEEAFEKGNGAYGQLRALRPDSNSSQVLERNGMLPAVRLVDTGATTRTEMKNQPGEGKAFVPTQQEDSSATESKLAQLSLVEQLPRASEIDIPFLGKYITYEDGTTRLEKQDGTIEEKRKHGDVSEVHQKPDGNVTVTMRDGTKLERSPSFMDQGVKSVAVGDDGRVVFTYNAGTVEVVLRDGTTVINNPDGSMQRYDKDGNLVKERTVNPDGSFVTTEYKNDDDPGRVTGIIGPDGRTRDFKYGPDGELTEIEGHLGTWKRMVDPDGKVYWQNQDHPEMKWHGEMKVDKDGNLHYTPHDPKAQAWIFTRDGRDVKA